MAGVNKAIIVGNLGADPDIRTMPSGDTVVNISVATSETWNDRNTGERREVTEWHRIVFFRRLAEVAGQYLKKGSQVYVEGRIKTRKWQDQNGQDRYSTEIHGDVMQMLGNRGDNMGTNQGGFQPRAQQSGGFNSPSSNQQSGAPKPQQQPSQAPSSPPPMDDFDDDIPF